MAGLLHTIVWFGWAIACALGLRIGFTLLFRRRLGGMAQIAAYGMWFVFVLAGFGLVGLSGMQMYGFDAKDPRQVMGYWVFYVSPLGLPTVFGAPVVLIADVVGAVVPLVRRAQTADAR